MKLIGAKIVLGLGFLALSFLIPNISRAQVAITLSGAITDSAGKTVSNATNLDQKCTDRPIYRD